MGTNGRPLFAWYEMNTATIATITVTAPMRTGLAPSCRVPRLIGRAGSRGRGWLRSAGAASGRRGRRGRGGAVAADAARPRRIRRRHTRLGRAEELVAALDVRLVRLDLVGRALVHERRQPQHVAHVVERVRGERLPVEEVPDRLHAGEAGAVGGGVRLVARGRPARRRATIRLDAAAAVVDRLQQLAQRLGEARRVLRQAAQLADLLVGLQHRPAAHHATPRRAP